eukprot:859754-Lingulodinium_polyedra.AAC.1
MQRPQRCRPRGAPQGPKAAVAGQQDAGPWPEVLPQLEAVAEGAPPVHGQVAEGVRFAIELARHPADAWAAGERPPDAVVESASQGVPRARQA